MPEQPKVLLLGGTGRTGRRALEQLLRRGAGVRAIVRSAAKLPAGAAGHSGLTVVEADLLSLSDQGLLNHVRGCDTVISCLGHVLSIKGVFGPPHDLVTRTVARVHRAAEALDPAKPVRMIVMSSVSVNHPGAPDPRRGTLEKGFLRALRVLVPPSRDNQRAADFLFRTVGATNAHTRWVVVRPDTLLEGDLSPYTLHEGLVSSLFAPAATTMANVAHFMCELATDPTAWEHWKGKLPVIVDTGAEAKGKVRPGGPATGR
jgi:nucleoside-diphosphate-sugar epimerase